MCESRGWWQAYDFMHIEKWKKQTNKQNETNVSAQTRKQPSETINISGNSDIAADLALIINNTPDVQNVPILQFVNVEFLKR